REPDKRHVEAVFGGSEKQAGEVPRNQALAEAVLGIALISTVGRSRSCRPCRGSGFLGGVSPGSPRLRRSDPGLYPAAPSGGSRKFALRKTGIGGQVGRGERCGRRAPPSTGALPTPVGTACRGWCRCAPGRARLRPRVGSRAT